jgi:uncharacterized repeat protein (TIGR03806 family)
MTLDVPMIALHGGLLAIVVSVLIMGSLRANPRLFLRHFPAKVRESQPPLSAGEKGAGRIVGLLMLLVFVGIPVWSATVFAARHDADLPNVFVHAFLVGMVANLVDWLLLDELWLGVGRPRWALPSGVVPADVLPFDHGRHFRAFLNGAVIFAVIALIAALAAPYLSGAASSGPRASVILAEDPAPKLSDYGFFSAANAGAAINEGVVPYDLVNALFSDHAAKHRYVYVPKGQSATYNDTTVFDFPVGSVLIKTFAFAPDMRDPALNERYIETRLLIRKQEGWVAYPYIWNAEQTEAVYSPVGGRQMIDTISPEGTALSIDYGVPNRNQCQECHGKDDELVPIGPSARNLNHVGPSGASQIADWTARGILTGAPPADQAGDLPTVPSAFGDAPLDQRARAWLDINCAHCHKIDGGASNSALYLGWNETDPAGWGVRKRPVAAGHAAGDNLFVIEPGHPEQSILVYRIESTKPGTLMPELGRTVVDQQGLELVRDWIAGMPEQPGR